MHGIFLIHLSVYGHLAGFRFLAIVTSAAINTRMHVSFWIIVLFRYIPRSGMAESYSNSVFSFLRNLHAVFPIVTVSIYIPTNSVEEFPLPHTLSSICYL